MSGLPTAKSNSFLEKSLDRSILQKSFNPKQLAKKLLPFQNEYLDIEEWPGEWQEENNTQRKSDTECITELEDIRNLRTWSRISFREKVVEERCNTTAHVKPTEDDELEKKTFPTTNNEGELKTVMQQFLDKEENFQNSNGSNIIDESCRTTLPLIEGEGMKVFRFFYLDVYEDFSSQNKIYLFGKTYCSRSGGYRSCSVIVTPLKRRLFVVPRHALLLSEMNISSTKWNIVKEFYNKVLKPLGICSFKYRFTWKKKLATPVVGNNYIVLEIEYSASYPSLPTNVEGETFSEIYGSNSSCLENFILDKKLKGPSWLDVSNPQISKNPSTWSFFELTCNPDSIFHYTNTMLGKPPLTVLSLHIQNVDNTEQQENKINMISWSVSHNACDLSADSDADRCYCVFLSKKDSKWQQKPMEIFETFKRTMVKETSSEKDLLLYFAKQFHSIDPDVIVGYDFQSSKFHSLIERLLSLNITEMSKLSRFKKDLQNMYFKGYLFVGRLTYDFKELMNCSISQKKQGLDNLYEDILDISAEKRFMANDCSFSATERRILSVVLATNESLYLLNLAFSTRIIPLCMKLTNISGNLLSQTFSGSISKRCEFLLLHTFSENGFLLPNSFSKDRNEITEEISGGLVLEPKKGFYDNFVLLMDFQSLYPSIIIEFNICLSHPDSEDTNSVTKPLGLLPSVMKKLLNQRKAVKTVMRTLDKKSSRYSYYLLYQNSLKLCMNGIIGCLASKFFRFSCPSIAQKITSKGQEVLKRSVRLLENKGFKIIYGDTDSIMIDTNCADFSAARHLAEQLQIIINRQYSTIALHVDSIFARLLIVRKKRYAGVAVVTDRYNQLQYKEVLKGLNARKDWSPYACETGKSVIKYILSDLDIEAKVSTIKSFLHQTQQDLINHRVPITSLVITKYLAQNPREYSTKSSYPHVQVAIRCMENSIFWFKKGDPVSYVMCRDKDDVYSRKAYHLKELDDYPELVFDESFYIQKQLYPFIRKICEPFGIEDSAVAATLGLENMQLMIKQNVGNDVNKRIFESREPFVFRCRKCGMKNSIDHKRKGLTLLSCQNVNCKCCPLENYKYLKNQLIIAMRRAVTKYYRYQVQCNNRKCKHSSFTIALTSKCSYCARGKMKQTYNEMDLYLQLEYFRNLFNSELFVECAPWIRKANNHILEALDNFMECSGFEVVDLSSLFRIL